MSNGDDGLTAADVDELNREAVERSATFARLAATALVIVGIAVAVAWLWSAVRTQQRLGGVNLTFGSGVSSDSGANLTDRVDAFTETVGFLSSAALAIAVGLAVRGAADYMQSRVGGSVTGFQVGDRVADLGDGLDDE